MTRVEEEIGGERDALLILGEAVELGRRHAKTFVACGLLGALAGLAWVSRKEPTYRSVATLRLESDQSTGVLGDLMALTRSPKAVSEMEVLRSRTLAEEVARGIPGETRGLTTQVDSARLMPLASLLGLTGERRDVEEAPELAATYSPPLGFDAPPVLCVDFLAERRVRVSPRGPLFGLGVAGDDGPELEFQPGVPFEVAGAWLTLEPRGDLTGERFFLRSHGLADAVERLSEHTRVTETERNSNVIRVIHEDSDPRRAARTTNALCRLYLERNRARNEQRASQTVGFIQEQLEEQLAKLEVAEQEVVEIQRQNPKTVDVGVVGETLIQQVSSLQLEEIQLRMLLGSVEEALDHLSQGNLDALSRLEGAISDPVTASYVEQIVQLTSEVDLLDRSDSSAYKGMLQVRNLDLVTQADAGRVELDALRRVLEDLEAGEAGAFGNLLRRERVAEPDPLFEGYLERWSELDGRLRDLRTEFTDELPEIQTLLARLERLEEHIRQFLTTRLASLEARQRQYDELIEGYGERVGAYPEEERAKISVAIDGLRQRTLTHLSQRLAGLHSRSSKLEEERRELEEELARLPEEVRVLADPMRRREAHAEIVKFLLARQKEAEITRASTLATADFIDVAIPAQEPEGPWVPMHLFAGLVLGLGGAFAIAFVRQSVDRGIHASEELEEATGLTLFGSIPDFSRGFFRVAGRRDDFLALRDDPEGPVAESYRSLRSNLKFVLNTGQAELELKTIAFTSCTQGEGKSVTNADMALAFALGGQRVLLVDADMRRPAAGRYLGVDNEPGLSDVLQGRQAWRDCLRREVMPGVDVLPAGRQPAAPGDLLADTRTAELIAEVREAYDPVVFDVPPVLAVADIEGLAPRLDAVFLVVRSGLLSQRVVREGLKRLERVGANVVGCVLNAARSRRNEKKYGYGYGYGHDEARGHEEAA